MNADALVPKEELRDRVEQVCSLIDDKLKGIESAQLVLASELIEMHILGKCEGYPETELAKREGHIKTMEAMVDLAVQLKGELDHE